MNDDCILYLNFKKLTSFSKLFKKMYYIIIILVHKINYVLQ